jgi:hypothetical protein
MQSPLLGRPRPNQCIAVCTRELVAKVHVIVLFFGAEESTTDCHATFFGTKEEYDNMNLSNKFPGANGDALVFDDWLGSTVRVDAIFRVNVGSDTKACQLLKRAACFLWFPISIVRASDTENQDLFWAIKGAASGYGIVTEFKVRTESDTKACQLLKRAACFLWFPISMLYVYCTAVPGSGSCQLEHCQSL